MVDEVAVAIDWRQIQLGNVRPGFGSDLQALQPGRLALLRDRCEPGAMANVEDQLLDAALVKFPQSPASAFTRLVMKPTFRSE